jgi:Ca2+-binding EF-hand superfamily protein
MRVAVLLAIVAFPTLASAQQPCTTDDPRRTVDAIYRQVLERSANGEGSTLANQLSNGQTSVRDLVRAIAKSPEHRERFLSANGQNARVGAVTNLYRHLLGRAPDEAGLNSHVQALSRGGNLESVIDAMIDSPEYQQKYSDNTVPGTTLRYCRAVDDGGENGIGRIRGRFRNMDRNGDGIVQRDEWDGNRAQFDNLDWNRDGVLSGDEVEPGGRQSRRVAENFDPADAGAWTEESFNQIDRNNDNRITSSEWFHSADYFRRADRNRDGVLTPAEFTSRSSDIDNRADRFENLDQNRNGRIERREWNGSADAFEWLDRNNDNVLSRSEVVDER